MLSVKVKAVNEPHQNPKTKKQYMNTEETKMKKNMMTAAALMMAAIALTACGQKEQVASPAADNLMNVEVISTGTTVSETARSSAFMSETVTEAAAERTAETVLTTASSAKQTEAKQQTAAKKSAAKAEKKQPETVQVGSTEQKTEAAEKATQNTPSEAQQLRAMTDEERKETAKAMIECYCYVTDRLIYGDPLPIEDDVKIVKIDGVEWDARYHKITVPNQYEIDSIDDLKWQIGQVLTGKEYDDAVKIALDGEFAPIFKEFDGELYLAEIGKGTLYGDWLWDTMTISNVTDKGFTAELRMKSYGDMISRCRFDFTDVALGAPLDFRVSNYECAFE